MSLRSGVKAIAIYHIVVYTIAVALLTVALICITAGVTEMNNPDIIDTEGVFKMAQFEADRLAPKKEIDLTDKTDGSSHKIITGEFDNSKMQYDGDSYIHIRLVLGVLRQMIQLGGAVIVMALALCLTYLVLSFELYRGARLNNGSRCKGWLYVNVVMIAVSAFLIPVQLVLFELPPYMSQMSYESTVVGGLFGTIIQGYLAWVVHSFIKEIKEHGASDENKYMIKA